MNIAGIHVLKTLYAASGMTMHSQSSILVFNKCHSFIDMNSNKIPDTLTLCNRIETLHNTLDGTVMHLDDLLNSLHYRLTVLEEVLIERAEHPPRPQRPPPPPPSSSPPCGAVIPT